MLQIIPVKNERIVKFQSMSLNIISMATADTPGRGAGRSAGPSICLRENAAGSAGRYAGSAAGQTNEGINIITLYSSTESNAYGKGSVVNK